MNFHPDSGYSELIHVHNCSSSLEVESFGALGNQLSSLLQASSVIFLRGIRLLEPGTSFPFESSSPDCSVSDAHTIDPKCELTLI